MSISKGVAVQRILEVGLRKVLQQELEAARNSGDMVDVEEVFQHMAAQSVVLCVGDDATDEEGGRRPEPVSRLEGVNGRAATMAASPNDNA